jgi:hypothetical protein
MVREIKILPLHGPALLRLFDLELWEQANEPFEWSLLTIDPVEIHLQKWQMLLF